MSARGKKKKADMNLSLLQSWVIEPFRYPSDLAGEKG